MAEAEIVAIEQENTKRDEGSTPGSPLDPNRKATLREWGAVLGGVLGATLATIDLTISNASMRDIQGTLSASLDEGAWISSSYLIAEVITIPMTGWLARVFTPKRYILANTIIFIICSIACGLAHTLPQMIFARILQGLSGGTLIPMASYLVMTILPKSQQPRGLLIFSLCVSVGASLGPFIGGWITTLYGWQFAFYLNVLPGILMTTLIWICLDSRRPDYSLLKSGDWIGVILLSVSLGTLTYVLEEGNRLEWFDNRSIAYCTWICVGSFVVFLIHSLCIQYPLLNLRLLMNRTFFTATVVTFLVGVFVFSSAYIIPRFLLQMQNYDAFNAGKTMMWFGFPQFLVAPFVPALQRRVKTEWLVCVGLFFLGLSAVLNAQSTNLSGYDQFIVPQIIRAIGQCLAIAPLAGMALMSVDKAHIGSASAIYNMARNLGGSIGIAVLSTLLTQRRQFHYHRIVEGLNHFTFDRGPQSLDLIDIHDADQISVFRLGKIINREANILAFSDAFTIMAFAVTIAIVLLVAFRQRDLKRP